MTRRAVILGWTRWVPCVVLIATLGCAADLGGGPGPDATGQARAGDCLAVPRSQADSYGDALPDRTDVVDCDQPHVYEVVSVSRVATYTGGAAVADDPARLQSALRARGDDEPAVEERIQPLYGSCAYDALELLGIAHAHLGNRTVAGTGGYLDSRSVDILPTVNQGAAWARRPTLTCLLRFSRRADDDSYSIDAPVRAVRGALGRGYRDRGWPVGMRDCYDDGGNEPVPCRREHDLESVGITFRALGLVSSAQLRREVAHPDVPVAPRLAREVDRLCEGPLDAVLGTGWDRRHLQPSAVALGDWKEIEDVSFTCMVTTSTDDTTLPAGDLIGGGAADHVRPVRVDPGPETA